MQEIKMEWGLWNEICDFVPKEQFIEGVFLDENNRVTEDNDNNILKYRIGLKMYINGKIKLAREDDYLIKENGKCYIFSKEQRSLKNKLKKIGRC